MPKDYRVEKWTGNSSPSAAELKQMMEDEGFCVFQWSDSPGTTYPPHVHSDDQSHWIVSGTLEMEVTGQGAVHLKAGDRDFMPGKTEHAAKVIGHESVVYLIGSKR
ncbi:MAG TPA: cupin domain-containing protein [Pyrinomonadaceae bacterium]|nr:cupin domain-containing protein [Pyrinomonadaceae bacterium]